MKICPSDHSGVILIRSSHFLHLQIVTPTRFQNQIAIATASQRRSNITVKEYELFIQAMEGKKFKLQKNERRIRQEAQYPDRESQKPTF